MLPEWVLWAYAAGLVVLGVVCARDERRKWQAKRSVSTALAISDPKDDSRD